MKRLAVVFLIILCVAASLIGCDSGEEIAFDCSYEPIRFYYEGLQFGKLIESKEALKMFYDSHVVFQHVDKEKEMSKYDSEFFTDKSLVVAMFSCDSACNKQIKSVSRKNDKLWITVVTEDMKVLNETARFFIEVDKDDVKGVNQINYKMISISGLAV